MTDAGRLSDVIESVLLNHTHGRNAMLSKELVWEFRKFRQIVEVEAGEPCESFEVNTALLLSDLMRHLGFGDIEHDDVLGESAAAFVREFGARDVVSAAALGLAQVEV